MSVALSSPSSRFSVDPADLSDSSGSSSLHNSSGNIAATAAAAGTPSGRGAMYHSNGDSQSGGYSSVAHANSDAMSITGPSDGAQAQPAHSETYGSIVGYAFTVNYILGVGVLGMPYAFYKGGWVLSAMCLGLVSVMAGFTALWLVDVSLRAQYVKRQDRLLREGGELDAGGDLHGIGVGAGGADEDVAVQTPISTRDHHRYEMNELVEMFMGVRARRIYEVLVIIYLVGALWSYTSVFAGSLASQVPFPGVNGGHTCDISNDHSSACSGLYYTYAAIFAVVAIPLTCMDLREMKGLQMGLAIFRFVALATMMATSIAAIYSYPSPHEAAHSPDHAPYRSADFVAFDWANLGFVFPVAVYSQIFHHSVPGLSHPLQDKSKAPRIFTAVLATTFALYTALGITVAAYYGGALGSTCTLLWAEYTGGHDGDSRRPGWAWFISYMVVLFPPLDIISAFPLNAITLGNNLLCAFIEDERLQQLRKYKIAFRLLAAVPPVVGAMIVRDLGVILKYTGCVGVLIAFVYPCVLQHQSKAEVQRRRIQVPLAATGSSSSAPAGGFAASRRVASDSEPLSPSGAPPSGPPSYNAAWISHPYLTTGVFVFSVVGLVAVLVLSIGGWSN